MSVDKIESNDYVLIRHPAWGSFWGKVIDIVGTRVNISVWDDSDVGSGMLPDDYRGQPTTMNFPLTCIAKVEKKCQ